MAKQFDPENPKVLDSTRMPMPKRPKWKGWLFGALALTLVVMVGVCF